MTDRASNSLAAGAQKTGLYTIVVDNFVKRDV